MSNLGIILTLFISLLLSTEVLATANVQPKKKEEKATIRVTAPGTRLLAGEAGHDEFYILDKGQPDPVKPIKKVNKPMNSKPVIVTINKAQVVKHYETQVEINKTLVVKNNSQIKKLGG